MFKTLSLGLREELLEDLLLQQELEGAVIELAKAEVITKRGKKPCPYCKSVKVYKRGKQNEVQMYSCNGCSRWYSETTGTALSYIKLKSKWQSYLGCMEQGLSIKEIAEELEISIQTSFDWRHKILSSLSQFEPEVLSNEVECDELELALNNKGSLDLQRLPRQRGSDFIRNAGKGEVTTVQIVTLVQRNGTKILKAVESKRLSEKEIASVLDGKLAKGATLITDKHNSYKAYARNNPEINHKVLLARDHVDKKDKTIHLQKVNNTHMQLRKFLSPFNGVSSKYLQNYLNWFSYVDKINSNKKTIKQWFISLLLSDHAFELFRLFKENAVLIRT